MASTQGPKLIASYTVDSGSTSSITFSSIPQTYNDLMFVTSLKSLSGAIAGEVVYASYNGTDVLTNWTGIYLQGSGSAAGSGSFPNYSANVFGQSGGTAQAFNNGMLYIPNYTSSQYKASTTNAVNENDAQLAYAAVAANLWSNTAAITSVTFTIHTGPTFSPNSTIYLYGIKNS